MKIGIIGTGYVGLVAGACFASTGIDTVCVDIDEVKLKSLRTGNVPFFEPGLGELIRQSSLLTFSSDLQSITDCDVVFVAVGTPSNEDGSADLSHVLKVARDVAGINTKDLILVLKSTVPVGTNDKVRDIVKDSSARITVVNNPEFLKEGSAVDDFLNPDRVVIGTNDDATFNIVRSLYAPFVHPDKIIQMSPVSAEIVKYAANSLLATKVSFINEIARLCDVSGGDVEHVRVALGADTRIGPSFLRPGLGFGGSCFPKDLRALVHTGVDLGVPMRIAEAALIANDEPVKTMVSNIRAQLGTLNGKTICIWGLAFKPNTSDVRESASIRLIQALTKEGANVVASDPVAALNTTDSNPNVTLNTDKYIACRDADAIVLCTEWDEYKDSDFDYVASIMRGTHIFDGRNALNPETISRAGLQYHGIGKS